MVALAPIILGLLNVRKKQVLLMAEASMPPSQFRAFRQMFLNEFGRSGFERDLERVLIEERSKDTHGEGRNI
jgi:hypothetical protein